MKKILVTGILVGGLGLCGMSLADELPKKKITWVSAPDGISVSYMSFHIRERHGFRWGGIEVTDSHGWQYIFHIDAENRVKKVSYAKGPNDADDDVKDSRKKAEIVFEVIQTIKRVIGLPRAEVIIREEGNLEQIDMDYRVFLQALIEIIERTPGASLAVEPKDKLTTTLGRVKSGSGTDDLFVQKKRAVLQETLQARKAAGVLSLPARDQAKKRRGVEF